MDAARQTSNSWTLGELLTGVDMPAAAAAAAVTGLALDSRRAGPGDLFLACGGTRHHGAAFIDMAVERGAAAVAVEPGAGVAVPGEHFLRHSGRLVPVVYVPGLGMRAGLIAERFFGNPSKALTVIGVTGTNGKTSVSQFLAYVLHRNGPCGVVGTLGSGLSGSLASTGHTTPDAVSLHRMLAEFRDAGARSAVMEVSSHGLEQGRVSGIEFDTAVFTNLTHEHLDYHGSMENYAAAKRRLFDLAGVRNAVVNTDDLYGRAWAGSMPAQVQTITYGFDASGPRPALYGHDLTLDTSGLSFEISSPWGEGRLAVGLLGRFNASNLLAALGALLASGISFDEALAGLAGVSTVPGRMERFGGDAGRPLVVVDYAHTPDALRQVLGALAEHCRGALWCVFGCGGERDREKRPAMGRVAEELADHIVLTDDNPRGEDPTGIIEQIQAGMHNPDAGCVIRDRGQAIAHAISLAKSQDIVLIAGKGHETEQLIGGRTLPFSDRVEVTGLIQEAAGG